MTRSPAEVASSPRRPHTTTRSTGNVEPRSSSHQGSSPVAVCAIEPAVGSPAVLPSIARAGSDSPATELCVATPTAAIFLPPTKTSTSASGSTRALPGNSTRTKRACRWGSAGRTAARTRLTTKLPAAPPAPLPGKDSSGSDSMRNAVNASPAGAETSTVVVSLGFPGATFTRPSASIATSAPAALRTSAGRGEIQAGFAGKSRAQRSAASAWADRAASNLATSEAISASQPSRFRCCSALRKSSTGDSSLRSASSVWLRIAYIRKYSLIEIGSYLCVWHCAHAIEVPIHTAIVVFTRSTTATERNSSSSVPPSVLFIVFRWKPVAMS